MKKKILFIILVLMFSHSAWANLKVVTTTQDLAAITEAIGASHVDVYALTPGTRDPHFAEAKPSMIKRVFRADMLISVGAELEVGWLPAVLRAARNRDVQPGGKGYLDLSKYVELLDVPKGPVDRSMGDVHVLGNPHYWLDPQNGLAMAKAIATHLSTLDADNATDYQRNLTKFEQELNERYKTWQQQLAFLKGKELISYHSSLRYLAKAFGFEIVSQVEPKPGIAPSAAHLAELVNLIKERSIQWLIVEPYYETRSGQFLNRQTGIKVVTIPQSVGARENIKTYFDVFDGIVSVFKEVH